MWRKTRVLHGGRACQTLLLGVLLAMPANLDAQTSTAAVVDSLRQEIAALRAQLDSLKVLLQRLESERAAAPTPAPQEDDPVARLRAAAAAAVASAGEEGRGRPGQRPGGSGREREDNVRFVGRQRTLQALNPEVTAGGDFMTLARSHDPNQDNFVPREVEISFQATLDPYSRAKFFASYATLGGELEPFTENPYEGAEEDHGSQTGEFSFEEAYIEWVNLPGGLGLSLGKFRQRLGTFNRWHLHALPMQQLPLPYVAFLGWGGLSQVGASLYWLVPIHGYGTYQLWTEVTRSSNSYIFGESQDASYLAHLNAFWDLSPSTYFEVGLSGVLGDHERDGEEFLNQLYHLEAGLRWRPPGRGLYREFSLRGALLWNHQGTPVLTSGGAFEHDAFGAYAQAEYRLSRRWLAGGRYEYTENPVDPSESTWLVGPTLTWWQSEFVRIRFEYDWMDRPFDEVKQFSIQFTFAIGPHKHETY